MANIGFWLVQTGAGSSEVQQFPAGQRPLSYKWGKAVYLGPTVADAKANTPKAAATLGVPNPQKVPSLGTSAGIIGSILAGFGLGAAAVDTTAVDIGAAAAGDAGAGAAIATGPSAAGSSAAGTATGAAAGRGGGSLFSKVFSSITSPVEFLAFLAWIFHPATILRAVEFVIGAGLILLGIHTSMYAPVQSRQSVRAGTRRLLRKSPVGRVVSRVTK